MELIYILTYDCNFRCKYCDIDKRKENITGKIIKQSLFFLGENNFDIKKTKFFGGEPLLMKHYIKDIINNFPFKYNTTFFITTNSTLINDNFIEFSKKNKIKLTFSIDGEVNTNNENRLLINGGDLSEKIIDNTKKYSDNIRVNQVITSTNSKDFFKNFKFIYDLGIREFNFLPEYYREWSKQGLMNLKKGFDQIYYFYNKGNKFNLINLDNYSETSFFNLGLVIDTNGKIYGTNLILSGIFEKYKKELIIGNIYDGLLYNIKSNDFKLEYITKIDKILQKEYSYKILKSVKYIDLILNNFCNIYINGK